MQAHRVHGLQQFAPNEKRWHKQQLALTHSSNVCECVSVLVMSKCIICMEKRFIRRLTVIYQVEKLRQIKMDETRWVMSTLLPIQTHITVAYITLSNVRLWVYSCALAGPYKRRGGNDVRYWQLWQKFMDTCARPYQRNRIRILHLNKAIKRIYERFLFVIFFSVDLIVYISNIGWR